MRRSLTMLFVHIVWSTWNRLPLIDPVLEPSLQRVLSNEAAASGCTVVALNGTVDHIHMLLRVPATATVAGVVKQVKGVSSAWANTNHAGTTPFKWQGHYGAFSVSRSDVDRVAAYVRAQKEHHAAGKLMDDLEITFDGWPGEVPRV